MKTNSIIDCTIARLHDCTIARLHDCTIARLHDCTIARLHDCTIARLHDCTIAHSLTFINNVYHLIDRCIEYAGAICVAPRKAVA
ncbi:hypothetical protein [Enterococcus cecorum]|uniref:hypothetical protein n=1 Tax=Enterococcus cecorum TaxID=44008 RepID=UPI00148D486B|nr:hypothetical protein [Enterococcus cecorum]